MPRFSAHFRLKVTQPELDFVDVPTAGDIPLFIDPFAIAMATTRWTTHCHQTILAFFERTIAAIRAGDRPAALQLLSHLREPNETRLGFSSHKPRGAGIGTLQALQLFDALSGSAAVRTGFLTTIQECELMVDGIGRDKISDLTTNVIRGHLAEYTHDQCQLWNVPTQSVSIGPYFSLQTGTWESDYFALPVASGRPILLVPKLITRYDPAYDHQKYYRRFVLDYHQAEHLSANSSLVHVFKTTGRRTVYKKDLEARYPCSKRYLYEFSRNNPQVLRNYRDDLARLELTRSDKVFTPEDEASVARLLLASLRSITAGSSRASDYHRCMVGIVEFLFFPHLIYPVKENEIHQGRKRIDIRMENAASAGIFERLHRVRKLPCTYAVFECKNYRTDVANPELDQLVGRFSTNRGRLGFMCCRKFEKRDTFIARARDTFVDGHGLIIALDDARITECLSLIRDGNRPALEQLLTSFVDQIWGD